MKTQSNYLIKFDISNNNYRLVFHTEAVTIDLENSKVWLNIITMIISKLAQPSINTFNTSRIKNAKWRPCRKLKIELKLQIWTPLDQCQWPRPNWQMTLRPKSKINIDTLGKFPALQCFELCKQRLMIERLSANWHGCASADSSKGVNDSIRSVGFFHHLTLKLS